MGMRLSLSLFVIVSFKIFETKKDKRSNGIGINQTCKLQSKAHPKCIQVGGRLKIDPF